MVKVKPAKTLIEYLAMFGVSLVLPVSEFSINQVLNIFAITAMSKLTKYESQTPTHKTFTMSRPCKGCGNEIHNILDHINCNKNGEQTTHPKGLNNTAQSD
jgi:hypothetical protein